MELGDVLDGRFRVDAVAGVGGMGTVHRATDLHDRCVVAVKSMHGAMERERFVREVELLRSLQHPAVVDYRHHGATPDGTPYLVMEWLDGEDLATTLRRGPLSVGDAEAVASRAADALGALHAVGIVHRDVKPANLFLVGGAPDRVKLLDFGLARHVAPEHALTGVGMTIGTLDYMAPEQARGRRDLTARADVFGLGCVLFECLTGRRPFAADHPVAILAKILLEDAPRVDSIRRDVPAPLCDLVQRMLAKEPALRPADGRETAEALRARDARPAPSIGPPRALTDAEQRVLPVILTRGASETDATLTPEAHRRVEGDVLREVARRGGRLEHLANGSLVVCFEGGMAIDQVGSAARCALALAAVLHGEQVVLATGRGVVGESAPVGEVIDRAAALLATSADSFGVFADDVTLHLLRSDFEVEGRRILRPRDTRRGHRLLLGRTTSCVGRDREIALLETTLDEAIAESVARVVVVTAPAGMGKSRLVREVERRAEESFPSLQRLVAEGDPSRAGSPSGMASELVGRAARLRRLDPPEARQLALRAHLESRGLAVEEARSVAELLGEIVAAKAPPVDASTALVAARADPVIMADAVSGAFRRWLDAECTAGPVMVVLEDLHWGDVPTVKLVDTALRQLQDRPLFVLATARPEAVDTLGALWPQRHPLELRLSPVTPRSSATIVKSFLGPATPAGTVDRIVARAAGNPFFLEELIRAVAEGSAPDDLPDSVLAVLQARFDALDAEDRRVLRAASVFGREFEPSALETLMGEARDDVALDRRIEMLVEREILERVAGEPPSGRVAFRHGLVRDAAYATLTDTDRRAGHRLAAQTLERAGAIDALTLAEHYSLGGEPRLAMPWYRRAAEQAFEGGDPAGTIERAERALSCGAAGVERAKLHLLMAEAEFHAGHLERAEALADDAAAALDPGGASWFDALSTIITSAGQRGDNDRVEEILERSRSVPAFMDAVEHQIVCLCRGASQLVFVHRFDAALGAAALADDLFAAVPSASPRVEGWMHRLRAEIAAFGHGDLQTTLDELVRTFQCFDRAGADRYACLFRFLRVGYLAYTGSPDEPVEATIAFERAAALGSDYLTWFGRTQISHRAMYAGDLAPARAILEENEPRFTGGRLGFVVQLFLSHMDREVGDRAAATSRARRALEIGGAPTLRGQALGMLALLAADEGRLDEAIASGREAVAMAETPGFDMVQNIAEYGLAVALAARGRPRDARDVLGPALLRLECTARSFRALEARRGFLGRRYYTRDLLALARELDCDLRAIDALRQPDARADA